MPGQTGFIFDMDGVLVENARYHTRAWLALFEQLGLAVDPQSFHLENAGQTNAAILRWKLGEDLPEARLQELAARKETLYRDLYRPHLQPLPGLLPFLGKSRSLGVPMALATSADVDNISLVLDGLGVSGYFRAIVGGEDIQRGKPDPEIFLVAAERMGVSARQCAVFEDSLAGIQAAQAASMRLVLITTSLDGDLPVELEQPDIIAPDFTSLDPREVLRFLDLA